MGFTPIELPLEKTAPEGRHLAATLFQPESPAAPAPRQLIILMHGWGADSQDLLPLAPLLAQDDPQKLVVVPDAPDICSANPFGRQWFELASPDLSSDVIAQACSDAAATIHHMLDSLQKRYSLPASEMVLGGFSQGGMIALTAGLGYSASLGGIFCLSGGWLTPDQALTQTTDLPIFLAHGDADPVVPIGMMKNSEAALMAKGFAPQCLVRPSLPHSIDEPVIDGLANFITKSC